MQFPFTTKIKLSNSNKAGLQCCVEFGRVTRRRNGVTVTGNFEATRRSAPVDVPFHTPPHR
ncbi:hypothetical protein HBI81_158790 [Parastagonospora nodorum]|nr:hypothetical protein HBI10_075600 [Parastagonospora nodorum]KAH4025913.1 hypothetical protein HBI13_071410 [Parastagonospora nodorum]KAH4062488.1 hypothetical protein HBH50_203920 [Parastagonospora nodorum]KAH4081043.1 hypothetical protein HBH48_199560 [Parastagonospora nodorum]KAH4105951.1 hypothetical protein HBH46_074180 [Parastagonospora nodorum]